MDRKKAKPDVASTSENKPVLKPVLDPILTPSFNQINLLPTVIDNANGNTRIVIAKYDEKGNEIEGTEIDTNIRMFNRTYSQHNYLIKKK